MIESNLAYSSATFPELDLFDFGGGDNRARTDCRCWTFLDVREALQKIAEAPPPASDEAAP